MANWLKFGYRDTTSFSSQTSNTMPPISARNAPFWVLAVTLCTALFGFGFNELYRSSYAAAKLDPELLLGGPIPKYYSFNSAFKAENGAVVDLIEPKKNIRLMLALSDPDSKIASNKSAVENVSPPALTDIIEKVRLYKQQKITDPSITPLTARVLASKIDPRRAKDIENLNLDLNEYSLPVQRFSGKGDERFLVGVANLPRGQVAILAFTMRHPIDPQDISQLLNDLPLFKSLIPDPN